MYISEFSSLTGASCKAIRLYESIGLLPEAKRKGSYRVYDTTYVETVIQIKSAQALGFKLSEIKSWAKGVNIERGLPAQVIICAIEAKRELIKTEISLLKEKDKKLEILYLAMKKSPCMLDSTP